MYPASLQANLSVGQLDPPDAREGQHAEVRSREGSLGDGQVAALGGVPAAGDREAGKDPEADGGAEYPVHVHGRDRRGEGCGHSGRGESGSRF